MAEFYNVVGQNNRNALVQSKRLAPYHEDITVRQSFDQPTVNPGETARIKLDFKHATDREIILNDIRLRFSLDFSARSGTGSVFAIRGTDLIREMVIKINEDIIFKADRQYELSHLWLMNNHRLGGEKPDVNDAYLMNAGILPAGFAPPLYYNRETGDWHYKPASSAPVAVYMAADTTATPPIVANTVQTGWTHAFPADSQKVALADARRWTQPGLERHDGLPRIIYSDDDTVKTALGTTEPYRFVFDISLNQLVGPIFHRLHLRRIEFVQIELMFEPWVSMEHTQNFLLFNKHPLGNLTNANNHPYSMAKIRDLEIRQYRTTLLDGVQGFTLPDNRMLSWLMHRFSRRTYKYAFGANKTPSDKLQIRLNDWEIRTNITRIYWMLAPRNSTKDVPAAVGTTARPGNTHPKHGPNGFAPYAAPCEPYTQLIGSELYWKNDKVLDLDTVYQVYRHYILSENKRYSLQDPYVRFQRLLPKDELDTEVDNDETYYTWNEDTRILTKIGHENYEMPIYHLDLNMNIQNGANGSEIVGGIVNDTADYVLNIKPVYRDEKQNIVSKLENGNEERDVWVFLEYQTLVSLAAGSSQFNRSSQAISKQLNTP